MTSLKKLKAYELALIGWVEHKGLEGQGGSWNATARKYNPLPVPTPDQFNLSGYELVLADKIKAQILPGVPK